MARSLPSGTVTFLFTDIEGSTKLAQEHPQAWTSASQEHDGILRSAAAAHNGYVFKTVGDAFCVAFASPSDALTTAIESQRRLQGRSSSPQVKVRMGLHTGEAELLVDGDYQGYLALSRVQRLMSAGHGGQVLLSLAAQELVRDDLPQGVSLLDLGERRLKDLIRPEHVYQLVVADLLSDFPPLKTLDAYRHNLPAQMTSFVGREKEIGKVKAEIAAHRLVTLTGSGGTGKTRLSLQVAAALLDSFPDGIWFVELAPLTDAELIPHAILAALGVPEQTDKPALAALEVHLKARNLLLLLDNCEHLILAASQVANSLLNAAPHLKILASSREALGVPGELAWPVPSLAAPDPKKLPDFE